MKRNQQYLQQNQANKLPQSPPIFQKSQENIRTIWLNPSNLDKVQQPSIDRIIKKKYMIIVSIKSKK